MFDRRAVVNLALIGGAFLGILALAGAAEAMAHPLATVATLPLIAALQNHLQQLQHEAAHGKLLPGRAANDLAGDFFCSLPFLGSLRAYRAFHLAHHRHLLAPARDPELPFYAEQGYRFAPLPRRALLRLLVLDLSGYHYAQFLGAFLRRGPSTRPALPRERAAAFAAAALGVALLLLTPRTLLLYWFLPQATFLFLFQKIQGLGEHGPRAARVVDCTWSHTYSALTRFFVCPLNAHLHREHHEAPHLPWLHLTRKPDSRGFRSLWRGEFSLYAFLTRGRV